MNMLVMVSYWLVACWPSNFCCLTYIVNLLVVIIYHEKWAFIIQYITTDEIVNESVIIARCWMLHGMFVYLWLVKMLYPAMIDMATTRSWKMPSRGMIQMGDIYLPSPIWGLAPFSWRPSTLRSSSTLSRECMVNFEKFLFTSIASM